jgi:uncharacterized protein YjiS (DUF1127 family)
LAEQRRDDEGEGQADLVWCPDAEDHDVGRFVRGKALVTLQTWRNRVRQRRKLAQWTDRDLHDVGLSWTDIALEIKKPFWPA